MTDITAVSDICAVNHQSSDAEKYKILTASQSFDRKYEFPQTQFGMKSNGKPHMRSFSKNWLEEFGQDGLMYYVVEDAAYCKYCRLFPGGERGLLVENPFWKWKDAIREFQAHFHANQKSKYLYNYSNNADISSNNMWMWKKYISFKQSKKIQQNNSNWWKTKWTMYVKCIQRYPNWLGEGSKHINKSVS